MNVVYTPKNGHKADIIFIHGLGGTSRLTWSKYRKPELFWPLTFLPLEPDLCLARILTFGYDADLRKAGNATTSILDFAKSLLYDLKYAKNDLKEDLDMGSVSRTLCASSSDKNLTLIVGASDFRSAQHGGAHNKGGNAGLLPHLPLPRSQIYPRLICKDKTTPRTSR